MRLVEDRFTDGSSSYRSRYLQITNMLNDYDHLPHGKSFHFSIDQNWNGKPITHPPIEFTISAHNENSVRLKVKGPFFNDPPGPLADSGKPCEELWEYEVAEIFFLANNEKYLEVELCPHGQHLVLLLHGTRKVFKDKLDIDFTVEKSTTNMTWSGNAIIPVDYFPPGVNKINAYAIHGSGSYRQYEALYPANETFQSPDFHRLQFFKAFDFRSLFDCKWIQPESSWWKNRNSSS